jgi:spoIIIJ-associated protein
VADPHDAQETQTTGGGATAPSERAEEARTVLDCVLGHMGIEATVSANEEAERIVLNVTGTETGLVIGKKGQTLDALQFLMNKIVNRDREGRKPIVVDSEGYRVRRADSLVELALRLGEKAVRTHRTITVNPMSPHDRRIIHMALDKVPGVSTRSEGEGAFRRLLIVPAPDKL